MTKNTKELRWGYSTGACAAAIATASWLCHAKNPCQIHDIVELPLHFLDGQSKAIPLLPQNTVHGFMAIQKDGGDDPDCTHNAILYGNLEPCHVSEAMPHDYVINFDNNGHILSKQTIDISENIPHVTLIIHTIEGIGLCTRLGLDCEQNKWAINSGPRAMIALNLAQAGLHSGIWRLQLGVQNGETLARHTLNRQLGIMGGISILGTTGHVRPYSHDAYIATVRICVQSNSTSGNKHMIFCTGGRTMRGARSLYANLPETSFVCIGDFIAESLVSAEKHAMQEVTVACMAGKLCKYAAGFEYTHAHTVAQDMELLRTAITEQVAKNTTQDYLDKNTQVIDLPKDFHSAPTVREALLHIPDAMRGPVLEGLARQALEIFAQRCNAACLRLAVFDFDGTFLFASEKRHDAREATMSTLQGVNHDTK